MTRALHEGGKGFFVTRDGPFLFAVKCEIAFFFLVNRDYHSCREL